MTTMSGRRAGRRRWVYAGVAVVAVAAGASLVYATDGRGDSRNTQPVLRPVTIYYSDGTTEMAQVGHDNRAPAALDRPTGQVLHNVMDELSRLRETDRNIARATTQDPQAPRDLAILGSGLKIVTTIDKPTQDIAELYADVTKPDSPLYGVAPTVQAALVAVEPHTGRVIAYYGGPSGAGADYAGSPADPVLSDGTLNTYGFHPPAGSFMIYTLGAAMSEGISINSLWNGSSSRQFPGRDVKNANAEGPPCPSCPLWKATVDSLNVPYYALTLGLKNQAASVLDFAWASGVRKMRAEDGEIFDLTAHKASELAATGTNTNVDTTFGAGIGFGQYGVTVLDHANGVASLAAGGNAAGVHFIREAWRHGSKIYEENTKLTPIPGYSQQMAADEAWTLQKVADKYGWSPPGRRIAAKTGTWENRRPGSTGATAHSWTVGYAAPARAGQDPAGSWNGVAVAVWAGNKGNELPLKLKDGKSMTGSNGAGQIFGAFMKAATEGKPVGVFPEPRFVGDENAGDAGPGPS